MSTNQALWIQVDEEGRLVVPPQVAERYGFKPGARARVDLETNGVRLHRALTQLAKVYIEPTNICNITCRTCMRNDWNEPQGMMSPETFERILADLASFDTQPLVFFGGIGEPLAHPQTLEMVRRVKLLGATVELITNGTLLTESRARQLITAGLDTLWISLDGATPEAYADVRLGAELPKVIANLEQFRVLRRGGHQAKPAIGVAFVALKQNVHTLGDVMALGRHLGATRFSISNVLPYTQEMRNQVLYERTLKDAAYLSSDWLPRVSMPKMDLTNSTREAFFAALESGCSVNYGGNDFNRASDVCNFIESGAIAIGWDGSVSPCLPLLHNHIGYIRNWRRASRRHVIGSINEHGLADLWNDPGYVAYRERVHNFAFAPCSFCGGCELLENNEEDCVGNTFPTCGGCLWAQGVIQCP